MSPARPSYLSRQARLSLLALSGAGVAASVAAVLVDGTRGWSGVLTAAFFLLTVALGGLVFLAVNLVGKAAWFAPLKRIPEAFAAQLPFAAGAMLLTLAGMTSLYEWMHPGIDLHGKEAWLQPVPFAARMAVCLGLWILFAWAIRRRSLRQDADGALRHTTASVALGAGFLVVLGLSFTVASVDWLMSLDPHWVSTIFGWYQLAGVLVAGVASIAVAMILLMRRGALPGVTTSHVHDLGKLLFGFSTLWAYLWFSQFLLIWYANIPEETRFYAARFGGGWKFLFWLNLVAGWVVPFIALLPRAAKRSGEHLLRVAGFALFARWFDVYLTVAPSTQPEHPGISWFELAPLAALAPVFVLLLDRALRAASIVPLRDPYLDEGIHYSS